MDAKRAGAWGVLVLVWMSLGVLGETASPPPKWTVREAIAHALEQHPDVRQAKLALELAELNRSAERLQGMIPSIGLVISPPKLSARGVSGDVVGSLTLELPLAWGTSTLVSAGLDLSWSPWTGTWGTPAWSASLSQKLDLSQPSAATKTLITREEAVDDARVALARAQNAVIRTTLEAYASLLQEEAALAQDRSAVTQAEARLKQEQRLADAGLVGESALTQARLDLLNAQIALSEDQSTHAADKARFGRQVLGTEEDYELVAFQTPTDTLENAASALLADESLLGETLMHDTAVKAAVRAVTSAQENLQAAKRAALPSFSLVAGVSAQGWQLGVTAALPVLSPTREADVRIAETRLAIAEDGLLAMKEDARDRLLTQQTAVRSALASLDRLPMEREKWSLDETVTKAKWEAGSLSDEDWQTFQEDRQAFLAGAAQRGVTLLVAYLRYRDGLGLDLEVEEWLK